MKSFNEFREFQFEEAELTETFDGSKVRIHSPGHSLHGMVGHVFHRHDDGRVNVQVRGHGKGNVRNLTLKPNQFKSINEEAEIEEGFENLPGKATHILNKDARHPEHGIIANGTVLRKTGEDQYEIRAGRAKGKIAKIGKEYVNKMEEGYVPPERNRPDLSAGDKSKLGKVADLMAKEKAKKDLPFTPDKPHKPVATAGKYGSGYSTARHLARQGMKDVQKEEVDLEEEITPVQSAAARQKLKQIEKSGVKKSQELYNKLTRIANAHPIKEETKMSQMDQYLAAISGNADFRSALEEKKLTPAEMKKREEIAQAMERENPGMDMGKKMAIATAQAKKVAEETELEEAISDADKETMKKRAAMARPELEKTKDVTRKFGGGEKGAKNVEQGFRSAIKRDYKKMDEEVVEEGKAHTVPKTEKEKDLAALAEPKDKITHADVLKGRGVTKEGVELKTFSQLMAELAEAKKDDYWDFKDLKDKPEPTTRKIAGTRYGGSAQKDEPEQDDEDDTKPAAKRGRGRPAGSKSGARH